MTKIKNDWNSKMTEIKTLPKFKNDSWRFVVFDMALWDMYEVNLPQYVAAAMKFSRPLFPNYPLFGALETQLTFMAVGEPD